MIGYFIGNRPKSVMTETATEPPVKSTNPAWSPFSPIGAVDYNLQLYLIIAVLDFVHELNSVSLSLSLSLCVHYLCV